VDKETAKYIINYFSNLLTSAEKMAIRHTRSKFKLEHSSSDNKSNERIYKDRGWLTSDPSVLDLLKDGYETFELNVANRIITNNPGKVFLNNCPRCNKIARTPYAKQCRHCRYSWRH